MPRKARPPASRADRRLSDYILKSTAHQRYIRRDDQGRFTEQVEVGRSLKPGNKKPRRNGSKRDK